MASKLCSICYAPFSEWGNNAEPVNSGDCCDLCNHNVVVPARINKSTYANNAV